MSTTSRSEGKDKPREQQKTDEALSKERKSGNKDQDRAERAARGERDLDRDPGTPLTDEEQREHAAQGNPSREDDAREAELNPKDLPIEPTPDVGTPQFQGEAEGGHVPAPTLSVVTNAMVSGDGAALTGHFATVVGGEHEGRYGILDLISLVDDDGKPLKGIMVCRDDSSERIEVDYEDLRRATSGRR